MPETARSKSFFFVPEEERRLLAWTTSVSCYFCLVRARACICLYFTQKVWDWANDADFEAKKLGGW